MLLNCGVREDSWESLGLQGDPTSPFWRRSALGVHWKDWCWGWNPNTLATSCKELTHWKRPWCWEGLGEGEEGDDRGWDGWMAWLTRWTWVWVNSGSWWWTGRPGVLWFMGSQRVRHDWATELNWTDVYFSPFKTEVPERLTNWPNITQLESRRWCWNPNVALVPLELCLQENGSLVLVMGRRGPHGQVLPWPEHLHLFNPGLPLVRSTPPGIKGTQPSLVFLPDLGNHWITSPAFQALGSCRSWVFLFESGEL